MGITTAFFASLLYTGSALVLLDGLDEGARPQLFWRENNLKRFAFDVDRVGDSQSRFCLIHVLWEADHGQGLLFGPWGTDLRLRRGGHSARSAGRVFGVSAATAVRFAAEHRARGTVVAKRHGRPPGRYGKLAPPLGFLIDILRAEPDITLKELAAAPSET